jgi:phosphoenolpyruvate-protein kinase (PTS system EI component)
MSFTLHGLGVSGGIAIGRAMLMSHATLEVAHLTLAPRMIDKEIERFDAAVSAVKEELILMKENTEHAPAELNAFIDIHTMFLEDPSWRSSRARSSANGAATPNGRWSSRWSNWSTSLSNSTISTCANASSTSFRWSNASSRSCSDTRPRHAEKCQALQGRSPDRRRPRPLAG